MSSVRTNCLDASALVKYYINEPGSDELAAFLRDQANWYTTPFCVYEGLNVLKRKKLRCEISAEQYYRAGLAMSADYAARTRGMNDINFFDPMVFAEVETLCRKHSLDFSDAFQVLSVKRGYYAIFVGDSQTVLVTADRALSKAAEAEGLKVKLLLGGSTDRPNQFC